MIRARVSVLAIALVLSAPDLGHAWCRSTTDQSVVSSTQCNTLGVPLAWKRRCFSYALDERGSVSMPVATIREVLARSFGHWEAAQCAGQPIGLDFTETSELATCQEAEYASNDGNVNVVAFIDDFEDRMLMSSAYAVTIVWHSQSTGEIYDADMLVNEELGPYGVCPASGCVGGLTVDLENVITHEAGHFLGLAHAADEESTMYYEAPRGETDKRSLAADDVAGICTIYPPGSLPESCSYKPRHGLDVDCEHESGGRCGVARGTRQGASPGAPGALLASASIAVVLARRRRR